MMNPNSEMNPQLFWNEPPIIPVYPSISSLGDYWGIMGGSFHNPIELINQSQFLLHRAPKVAFTISQKREMGDPRSDFQLCVVWWRVQLNWFFSWHQYLQISSTHRRSTWEFNHSKPIGNAVLADTNPSNDLSFLSVCLQQPWVPLIGPWISVDLVPKFHIEYQLNIIWQKNSSIFYTGFYTCLHQPIIKKSSAFSTIFTWLMTTLSGLLLGWSLCKNRWIQKLFAAMRTWGTARPKSTLEIGETPEILGLIFAQIVHECSW